MNNEVNDVQAEVNDDVFLGADGKPLLGADGKQNM